MKGTQTTERERQSSRERGIIASILPDARRTTSTSRSYVCVRVNPAARRVQRRHVCEGLATRGCIAIYYQLYPRIRPDKAGCRRCWCTGPPEIPTSFRHVLFPPASTGALAFLCFASALSLTLLLYDPTSVALGCPR